ncbi:hypothetical protein NE237_013501 [Protea cynaroides]|uniref:Uncharacterized protein n=1 Tax=Protea cynaroides TaxID=273540 RepID=A0A9Q0K088_9MAGN|nr:hypothetical protein NE237_013501 [Protea cynaroides]
MAVYKVVYHFQDCAQPKVLDPNKYGFIDVVYDIYNSVLRHIPQQKSISFKVKCVMKEIDVEMEIEFDDQVLTMLAINYDGLDIHLYVYGVNIYDEYLNAINGYPNTIIDKEVKFQMMGINLEPVRRRRIQKTVFRKGASSSPANIEGTSSKGHEVLVVPIISQSRVDKNVEERCDRIC